MWYIWDRREKKQQMVAETFWSQPPVNQDDASTTSASCTRKRNAFIFLVFLLSRFTRGSCSCAVRGNQPKSRASTTYSSQIIMLKILTTNAGKPKLHRLSVVTRNGIVQLHWLATCTFQSQSRYIIISLCYPDAMLMHIIVTYWARQDDDLEWFGTCGAKKKAIILGTLDQKSEKYFLWWKLFHIAMWKNDFENIMHCNFSTPVLWCSQEKGPRIFFLGFKKTEQSTVQELVRMSPILQYAWQGWHTSSAS